MKHPQRREWLLFDDRGNTWGEHSPELRRQLFCLHHDEDLTIGLVRNLGFVAGRSSGRNAALRLHLELASDIALAAAYYWLSDRGFYALALQADKKPCAVLSSNPGHALWSGIADIDKARQTAERLMADDLFNGWGIRESVFILYFRQLDLTRESALAFSLAGAGLIALLSLPGAIVWSSRVARPADTAGS